MRFVPAAGGMKPTTPTIGTAVADNAGATVVFTPSTYIGKGTITYTATSSPSSITATAGVSPIIVTGLSNGTPYTFTVSGTTNYGVQSDASAASNSVTPTAPAPPPPPPPPPTPPPTPHLVHHHYQIAVHRAAVTSQVMATVTTIVVLAVRLVLAVQVNQVDMLLQTVRQTVTTPVLLVNSIIK
jgi:hypothetical protein